MKNDDIISKNNNVIDTLIFDVIESNEFKEIQYFVTTIRRSYLHFLSSVGRMNKFAAYPFILPLINFIDKNIEKTGISLEEILNYMINFEEESISNWILIYYTNINSVQNNTISREAFIHIFAGFIIDYFRLTQSMDINEIVNQEVHIYPTNQYELSVVDGVEFKEDYFIFDGKAYLYNLLTNTKQLRFEDGMPGFARIITDQVKDGNILLRLDERLALPKDQAIRYSSANFEKYRGPQFHFQESKFTDLKTIIVHISPKTSNKLLMVIKKDYDYKTNKAFLHIEIETLPFVKDSRSSPVITTFLHGMYYLDDDYFTHIDYTKNQYSVEDYLMKYSDSVKDKPIDLYTSKELHYKIWCIENGTYSREVWYQLMIVSLPEEYQTLLNEILE